MVASVVFMLAASAALAAIGGVQRVLNNANRNADAAYLAQVVAGKLRGAGAYTCPGAYTSALDLLADGDVGAPTEAELNCFGIDSVGPGVCAPDYPRTAGPAIAVPDLTKVLGQSFDGLADNPVVRQGADGTGFPMVTYKGYNYRVVWNVACDMPVLGNKTVQVIVGWEPFATAIQQGRTVQTRFYKGEGV